MRTLQLELGMTALGNIDVEIEVPAAGNGNARDLEHLAGILVALLGDGLGAQQGLQPFCDRLFHWNRGAIVAALRPEAYERL
jgi:hypothetical protein